MGRRCVYREPKTLSESNMASPTIGTTVNTVLSASASAATYELAFRWAALQKTQARFKGRTVLEPEIDLGRYTCRAVIDWLDVRVVVGATTQWKWIKHHIELTTGQRTYVKSMEDGQGATGRIFRIRFQEPLLGRVMQAIDQVAQRWTLESAPELVGLEISVDLTPKAYSEEDLVKLFGVIARTHLPSRDVITDDSDRPRFFADGDTTHVINMDKHAPHKDKVLLLQYDHDVPPTHDSTYYTGAKRSGSSWRLMIKRVDRQNKAAGTFIKIPDDEVRVRLEVTLLGDELQKAGLRTLEDLAEFRFQTLQGSYFQFRLPTFRKADAGILDTFRLQKFLKAGVVGLEAMDDARRYHRPAIVRASRKSDKPLRPARRLRSRLVIYEDLTSKAAQALRHLQERQQGSLVEKLPRT